MDPSVNALPVGHSPTLAGVVEGGDGLNGLPGFSGGYMEAGSGQWGPTGHC